MPPPSRKPGIPRSFVAAATGWTLLSGIGLLVGGQEGGLIAAVASQILVLYMAYWTISQRQKRGDDQ